MDQNPFDLFDGEAARLDRFYAGLASEAWDEPTRCAGWTRKDLLAHLCTIEDYTRACLDDEVAEFAGQAGDLGYADLNDALVARKAGDSREDLLAEWRGKVADNHPRLRERGAADMIATMAGPYPLGRQTCYLAAELAIHADDAGVPVEDGERAARRAWRAAFSLEALAESAPDVEITVDGGDYAVHNGRTTVTLSADELIEAAGGRMSPTRLPGALRAAMMVLA